MLSHSHIVFLSALTSFAITYFAIPKIISFAKRFRLADSAGSRASHQGSIPVFGGVGIFAGFIFSLLFWSDMPNLQFIIASITIIFLAGIIDDLLSLTPYKKIIIQVISILLLIYGADVRIESMHGVLGIYELPYIISALFTIFVIVVIINCVNLIDGVDGLAGGIGSIACIGFGVVAYMMSQYDIAVFSFSLSGALLAFLKYNFHPAKIFMGDTGSLLIGLALSILAINSIKMGFVFDTYTLPNKGPLLAIVFLAVPLFDSLRVFIARVSKGRHPLHPGRDHIHHALLKLGFGHKYTSIALYHIAISFILCAYFLLNLNINSGIAILAGIVFLVLLVPFYLADRKK